MQVGMYAEYNKGLLNIERIQLFLPKTFYKDCNTGYLIIIIIIFFFLATFTMKATDCAEIHVI